MILLGDHYSTKGLVHGETPDIAISGSGEFSSRRLPQLFRSAYDGRGAGDFEIAETGARMGATGKDVTTG